MAFKGPAGELAKIRGEVAGVASGRFAARAREAAGDAVLDEAVTGWRSGRSPYGDRWTGSRGQPVSLYRSGELFRSLKLVRSPLGFKLTVAGKSFGRHTLATVQAYGGYIRAGVKTLTAIKGRRARNAAKRAGLEVQPMTFRTSVGWRSKFTVRIQGNPMLPKSAREVPPLWSKAIERGIEEVDRKHFRSR